MMRWYLLLISTLVLVTACNPHKRTLAEATSLRQGGLQKDAFDRYLSVYYQDPTQVEAITGLKETGTSLVNRYYSEVQMLHGQGNHMSALNALADADAFYTRYAWLDIRKPFYAENLKGDIHKTIGQENYKLAEDAVRRERWSEAREYLNTARRYDNSIEEIEYLDRMIRILPDFRKGQKAMDLGLYQEAYGYFEKVSMIDADFNNVLLLKEECIRKARITVTTMQMSTDEERSSVERSLVTGVKQEILKSGNPFVRLVVRDDLDYLLEEQRNSMSGAFDEDAVVRAGRLIGAEFVILGEIVRYDKRTDVTETPQKGYLGRNILMRKAEYVEKHSRRIFDAVYRYYLVRTETGEVLAAENVTFSQQEELHWADYDGDRVNLYPGNWMQLGVPSLQDRVYLDQKSNLDNLLRAPKIHTPMSEYEQQFIAKVGEEVARQIEHFAVNRRISD